VPIRSTDRLTVFCPNVSFLACMLVWRAARLVRQSEQIGTASVRTATAL
jgi:hypothetical protein